MAKRWEEVGAFKAVGTVFAKATGVKAPGVFGNPCGWLLGSEQECVNTTGSGGVCWEQHLQAFASGGVTLQKFPHIHKQGCAVFRG